MSYQFLGPNLVRVYDVAASVVFKPSQFFASRTYEVMGLPLVTISLLAGSNANVLEVAPADPVAFSGDVYTAVNDYLASIP